MTQPPPFAETLLMALGFACVIEGLFYAFFAHRVPDMLRRLEESGTESLRRIGVVVALFGLGWMVLLRWVWMS